jgi:hypothetical protein
MECCINGERFCFSIVIKVDEYNRLRPLDCWVRRSTCFKFYEWEV